eukprot:TRINITY_DN25953_c0_g2_i1.p1 TRINITY_DN25953_c0_g2~~TRINITY_DN25953_c0_g2_i1.p1  ORF type:complete len:821 (-),score=177.97 TRINITY_DN25953_c0_g2_i1:59-2521(-)
MGSRLNAIREACKLPPNERSEEAVTDILDFVRDVKFFSKLTTLQQRTLCRTMTIEKFPPRTHIFEVGDVGDKYYIILSGSVSVQVPSSTAPCPNGIHEERCDCKNRPLETAVYLAKGMGFGELALQSSQPRSATIFTGVATETLVTTRADYEKYAGELHKLFIEQRVKFLRQCPLIEESLQKGQVSTQDIAAMANCLNERSLSGSEMVVRQGDPVESLIFVRSGSLAMLKLVESDVGSSARSSPRRGASAGKAMPDGSKGRGTGRGADPQSGATKARKDESSDSESDQEEEDVQAKGKDETPSLKLAKAMIAMKQQERDAQLGMMYVERRKSVQEAKELTETVFGRRSSLASDHLESAAALQQALASAKPPRSAKNPRESASMRRPVSRESNKSGSGFSDDESRTDSKAANRRKAKALWATIRDASRKAWVLQNASNSFVTTPRETAKADRMWSKSSTARASSKSKATAKAQAAKSAARRPEPLKEPPKDRSPRKNVNTPRKAARKLLLRIGSVGAYQYFGEREVCTNEAFPCSLVSDPIAEIYTMSKHDVLRRLPKNLFSAIFHQEAQGGPSDGQLMDMLRQTERWFTYRRTMHAEALGDRNLRAKASGSKVDATANMEFLGVDPQGAYAARTLPPPRNVPTALTPKDEEHFSQTSARFLRRFETMKRDTGLQTCLAKMGASRRLRIGNHEEEDQDPMAIRFEQHWSKLRQDPFDLGDDLDDLIRIKTQTSKGAMNLTGCGADTPPRPSTAIFTKAASTGASAAGASGQLEKTLLPGVAAGSPDSGGPPAGPAWTATITTELPPISDPAVSGNGQSSLT